MDTIDEAVSVDEGSPDSADGDTTDTQTSQDPTGSKNRSKRKPSKTQIKHITPKGEHCDTSKYGTQNMEDLFNDVTQGIYHGTHHQLTSQTLIPLTVVNTTVTPTPPKRARRLSQASVGSTSSIRSLSSRPPPSYPCGICGKIFRVPSRYDSHMLGHSKGKPFCCSTCGKMFSSEDKLDHHLPVHNTDRKASFTCESCGKVCVNWRAYLYHLKAKHTESGGKRFACSICGRQFHTGQRLRNHMASHEVGKNHCCTICGKLFESRKKLDTHVMVHNLTSKHDQNLQCSDCGRQYSEWIAFKQHMKTHGAEGVQYPCGLCDKVFPTQYEKEKHKRVHKQVQCEFCERYFRSASVLSVHLRIHTGERPYKCGLCERDFSQASVLKVHMRTHRKEGKYECKRCGKVYTEVMEFFKHHMGHLEEGNLQCEECGKIFESINNKNRHMAAHRDRAGRICQVCGKEFGRISHLEAHMLCHSDQLPLLCKVCGKMFPSEEVLSAHYASHMGGELSTNPASKGPLYCGLCGKMFKGQLFLNNHMMRHEREGLDSRGGDHIPDEDVIEVEEGDYACSDCDKKFGQKHHLTVHRREHTGERPHTCILCGQSFTLRKVLLEHISDHKRSGLMMYTNQDNQLLAGMKPGNPKTENELFQDSESGSETETDHEESDNLQCKIQLPLQHPKYEQRMATEHSLPVQNNSFREDTYPKLQNNIFPEKNYPGASNNSCAEKLFIETQNHVYQEKHYLRNNTTSFVDKNYSNGLVSSYTDKNYINSSHVSVSDKSFMDSSNDSYNDKLYTQNPNNSMVEKRFLENPDLFSDKNCVDSRKIYSNDSQGSLKKYQSLSSSNGSIHPYGVSRNPYSLSLITSPNHMPSNNTGHLHHSNMQEDSYGSSETHIARNDRMTAMLRAEVQLPTNVQMSSLYDYKQEIGGYSFPYKNYMPSNISSLQSRNSFHGGFHNAPVRFSSDSQLSMSSFQLLPQTAFPENSHQA